MWSEGGKGSRAHSPELVVARVLVINHLLVATRILVVACVRSWALAVIREPRRPVWLVIRMRHGSWAIVRGRWAAIAAYGQ